VRFGDASGLVSGENELKGDVEGSPVLVEENSVVSGENELKERLHSLTSINPTLRGIRRIRRE